VIDPFPFFSLPPTPMRFLVTAPNFSQDFDRWIDALEMGKSLMPTCKGLFQEVRIFEAGELIWLYDRFHRYPQFIGPGTYNRLARLFLLEASEALEEEAGEEVEEVSAELAEG
jgi:hypothetical protein